MQALGWGILAEIPDREVVVGAVTQPWKPNVVFRGLPPDQFTLFREPAYVKIVWTLRADLIGPAEFIFRTETRVVSVTLRLARSSVGTGHSFRQVWRLSGGCCSDR